MEESEDFSNIMKILVATDNHLGFMEKDSIRGKDTLETFEEILLIAQKQDVDFILLGGDLFHENKPSRYVLFRTMELLRKFCVGSKPCSIEFRSDASVNFQSNFPVVNYEDPNYNISIPVFSIHGNHDDPTGDHSLSSNDILSVSNLVNYFGKALNVENITVSPVLLQKGSTKLALYGLGSIRDERLNQTFRHSNVMFLRPNEDKKNWFSIFVIHQNRAKHTANNYIPATYLPGFLDLVIWGHEHESIPSPDYQTVGDIISTGIPTDENEDEDRNGFYIYQPGSSVATSLSEGEVPRKHVGMLYIKGTDFKIDSIPLKTVRPFVMDTVVLAKTDIDPDDSEAILSYLTEKVNTLIQLASVDNPDSKKIPIVRVKVDYSDGYSIQNQARFCQYFVNKVANPKTILNWYRRKPQASLSARQNAATDLTDFQGANEDEGGQHQTIATLLKETLLRDKLNLLSEKNLVEAVNEFVDKNEKDAISDFVKYSLKQTQEFFKFENFPEAEFEEQLEKKRDEIMRRQEQSSAKDIANIRTTRPIENNNNFSDESNDDETPMETSTTKRGRGRGRGRGKSNNTTAGTRGGRGSRGSRGNSRSQRGANSISSTTQTITVTKKRTYSKKNPVVFQDDDDDDSDELINPKKKSKISAVDLTMSSDDDDEKDFNPF